MGWVVAGLALRRAGARGLSFTAAFYRPGSVLARLRARGPPEPASFGTWSDRLNRGCGTRGPHPWRPDVWSTEFAARPDLLRGLAIGIALMRISRRRYAAGLLAAAWFTVAVGAYLGYRLLRVERMSLSALLDGARAQYACWLLS